MYAAPVKFGRRRISPQLPYPGFRVDGRGSPARGRKRVPRDSGRENMEGAVRGEAGSANAPFPAAPGARSPRAVRLPPPPDAAKGNFRKIR